LACYNEFIALDLDRSGRAALLSYFVSEDCGTLLHPSTDCAFATTWEQIFTESIFLASSVPPAQWNPNNGLFGGENLSQTITKTPNSFYNDIPPDTFYYTSVYVGDINGNGFPDLVRLTPNGWSVQFNGGRAFTSPPLTGINCNNPGNACLALGGDTPFFPGATPIEAQMNVFMVDIDGSGTTSLLLRDPQGTRWYAAYHLTSNNQCPNPGCHPTNLALVGGEVYGVYAPRQDWFPDLEGDGIPGSVSIPYDSGPPGPESSVHFQPYVTTNTGNGFDVPVQLTSAVPAMASVGFLCCRRRLRKSRSRLSLNSGGCRLEERPYGLRLGQSYWTRPFSADFAAAHGVGVE
jgi:hypothetical protein